MFQKGEKNPSKGRKPGSKNKATAELKELILGALADVGGREYLAKQANENPTSFLSLIGRVLPMQVSGGMVVRYERIEREIIHPSHPDRSGIHTTH